MPKFQETDEFIVDLRQKPREPAQPEYVRDATPARSRGFLHFAQYNNAFLVVLLIGIVSFSGLAFASEDVRSETIGSRHTREQGVDNTFLIEADLENFSMDFQITGILEDDTQYLVSYSYVDIDTVNGAWQYVEKNATRRITKPFRQDLGVYLARQLAQEESARLKELRTAQKEARNEGATQLVQVTRYSGLIGTVLDATNRVFPGYEPVKTHVVPTPPVNRRLQQRSQEGTADNMTNVYNEWVQQNPGLVQNLNGGDTATSSAATATSTSDGAPTDTGTTTDATAGTTTGGSASTIGGSAADTNPGTSGVSGPGTDSSADTGAGSAADANGSAGTSDAAADSASGSADAADSAAAHDNTAADTNSGSTASGSTAGGGSSSDSGASAPSTSDSGSDTGGSSSSTASAASSANSSSGDSGGSTSSGSSSSSGSSDGSGGGGSSVSE